MHHHSIGDGVNGAIQLIADDPTQLISDDPTQLITDEQPPDDTSQTPDDGLDNPPATATNPDPLEIGHNNAPVFWKDPTHITIGLAAPGSVVGSETVSNTLTTQEITLLKAATEVWESVANVQFVFVNASPDIVPDISVGLSKLDPMQLIGYTHYNWNANNELQKAQVVVEDPAENPVTTLDSGNLRYNGFTTTMLQDFEHELGHALGLDHNETDHSAIMYPVIGTADPVPNANDIAALQSLYGAPRGAPVMTADDRTALHTLLAGTSLSNIA
jgi:hypothetical protein